MLHAEQTESINCVFCQSAETCKTIRTSKGTVVTTSVLVDSPLNTCMKWEPVESPKELSRRRLAWDFAGVAAIGALGQLTTVEEEGVNEDMLGRPDFEGMLFKGIEKNQRSEQLMFQTNDEGTEFLTDNAGTQLIRPMYEIRQFACDPNSHIKLAHALAIRWTTKAIVLHIVKKEMEEGLVVKNKKKTSAETDSTEKTPDTLAKGKDKKMAGRTIKITRGPGKLKLTKKNVATPEPEVETEAAAPAPKKTAGKKGGTKLKMGGPPKKTGAKDVHSETPKGLPEPQLGGDFADMVAGLVVEKISEVVIEDLQIKLSETISKVVNDKMNELGGLVEQTGHQSIQAVTILHDILARTEGTMAFTDEEGEVTGLPELIEEPDLILAYVAEGEEDAGE